MTRNMLYDVHTHVGLDSGFYLRGWWPYASTARDLLDRMDENRIGRAVCFPFTLPSAFDPYAFAKHDERKLIEGRFPFDVENALLADEIERVDTDKRLLQFAMFDPGRCVDQQVESIQKLVGKFAGLKTQTTVLQSPIRALLDDAKDLMHLAQAHNLPVLFHTAINPNDKWAQVSDCLEVAEKYPQVRFNLAHSLRFHAPLLKRARELPNVWVDCSAHLNHCLLAMKNSIVIPPEGTRVDANYEDPVSALLAVQAILGERYMWGSDNPYMSWCDDKLRLLFTYKQEADVLYALPESLTRQIAKRAPEAWLFGEKKS
jgi:predicted TIM-barrel fold metal-dependent hydrolase